MVDEDNTSTVWCVSITGSLDDPEKAVVVVTRDDPPRIRLEIAAPELQLSEEDQNQIALYLVQDAVTDLQRALDSPSALPGSLVRKR